VYARPEWLCQNASRSLPQLVLHQEADCQANSQANEEADRQANEEADRDTDHSSHTQTVDGLLP
jgi:hypothetical protein